MTIATIETLHGDSTAKCRKNPFGDWHNFGGPAGQHVCGRCGMPEPATGTTASAL